VRSACDEDRRRRARRTWERSANLLAENRQGSDDKRV
jgi:hypothetical protein